jgi:hypothetical protein
MLSNIPTARTISPSGESGWRRQINVSEFGAAPIKAESVVPFEIQRKAEFAYGFMI